MAVTSVVKRELFPTTVFEAAVEFDASAALREEILAKAASTPTVARGERTGWQSDGHLLRWSTHGQAVAELVLDVLSRALSSAGDDESMLMAWANVLSSGDYFSPHNHADAAWSGVWYLEVEPDSGGILEFRDPRAGAHSVESPLLEELDVVRVAPVAGQVIIFPSWLVHWVTPTSSDKPRISIAFNAR